MALDLVPKNNHTFEGALGRLKKGQAIARKDWNSPEYANVSEDGRLYKFSVDVGMHEWRPSLDDLMAEDWY